MAIVVIKPVGAPMRGTSTSLWGLDCGNKGHPDGIVRRCTIGMVCGIKRLPDCNESFEGVLLEWFEVVQQLSDYIGVQWHFEVNSLVHAQRHLVKGVQQRNEPSFATRLGGHPLEGVPLPLVQRN